MQNEGTISKTLLRVYAGNTRSITKLIPPTMRSMRSSGACATPTAPA